MGITAEGKCKKVHEFEDTAKCIVKFDEAVDLIHVSAQRKQGVAVDLEHRIKQANAGLLNSKYSKHEFQLHKAFAKDNK